MRTWLSLLFLIVLGVCLARDRETAAGREPSVKPSLVCKGEGFLIHALPGTLEQADGIERVSLPGLTITHTRLDSGEMKVLLSTGVVSFPTERVSYSETRILGLAANSKCLYVLMWSWGSWDRPPTEEKHNAKRFLLSVFELASGKHIEGQILAWIEKGRPPSGFIPAEDLPKVPTAEIIGPGPLKVTEDSLSCYGVTFPIKDGGAVVWPKKPQSSSSPASGPASRQSPT